MPEPGPPPRGGTIETIAVTAPATGRIASPPSSTASAANPVPGSGARALPQARAGNDHAVTRGPRNALGKDKTR